jgi:hypothetical protein
LPQDKDRGRSGRLEHVVQGHAGTARALGGTADQRRLRPIPASGDGVGWTVLAPGASVGGHVSSRIARRADTQPPGLVSVCRRWHPKVFMARIPRMVSPDSMRSQSIPGPYSEGVERLHDEIASSEIFVRQPHRSLKRYERRPSRGQYGHSATGVEWTNCEGPEVDMVSLSPSVFSRGKSRCSQGESRNN